MTNKTFRLFGGDASRQRAELFAQKRGWEVIELGTDEAPFSTFHLNEWGFDDDGIRYSYVATNTTLVS